MEVPASGRLQLRAAWGRRPQPLPTSPLLAHVAPNSVGAEIFNPTTLAEKGNFAQSSELYHFSLCY